MLCIPFRKRRKTSRTETTVPIDLLQDDVKKNEEIENPKSDIAVKRIGPRDDLPKHSWLAADAEELQRTHADCSSRPSSDEDPPIPYTPTDTDIHPPTYHAYEPSTSAPHPDFPANAIAFALRDSHPPQPSYAEELNKADRVEVEGEQSQFFSSIKYGDQINRGLDELERFREDRMKELGEDSGLTDEQIERRRRLSCWDGDGWTGTEVESDDGEGIWESEGT